MDMLSAILTSLSQLYFNAKEGLILVIISLIQIVLIIIGVHFIEFFIKNKLAVSRIYKYQEEKLYKFRKLIQSLKD